MDDVCTLAGPRAIEYTAPMHDQVIVITGASAGIGAALAVQLGAAGARLVLLARRRDALDEVAARCGPNALAIVADVTRRGDLEVARDQALARFGHIDVWVNNAGRGITRLPSEVTDADLDEMVLINLKAPIYGVQAVLPHFRARGRGQIVNVSSMLGRLPLAPIRSAYVAAKHALNGWTGSLRIELRDRDPGIVITSVHPGVVATEFGTSALHGGPDSRSLPGAQSAEEVAAVIVDAIVHRRTDVYTLPRARGSVASYYAAEDATTAEASFGQPMPGPPPAGR